MAVKATGSVKVEDLTEQQFERINEWASKAEQLKVLRPSEMEMRKEVFGFCFPDPKTGVNNLPLYNGYVLKATYKIDKVLDKAALPAVLKTMEDRFPGSTEGLIRYTPELDAKAYKALDEETKKIFDECLTERPASPTVEIVAPKQK